MPEQLAISENQKNAAIFVLADELQIPARTISWISAAVTVVSARKSPSSSNCNAREVCAALLRDLNEPYAGDIEAGLRIAKISCSEDIGRVVWALVSKKLIEAGPGDSVSQFNGLFRIDDLNQFLSAERIRRARFSWTKCKRYASWTFYLVGTAMVISSYGRLVSPRIAWIGWCIGMFGFALWYIPNPKRKRF